MIDGKAVARNIPAPRDVGRGLHRAEHRLLLLAGDCSSGVVALLIALWVWSLTTGFQFDPAFIRRWAVFAILVPAWGLLLVPARRLRVGLSVELTSRVLVLAALSIAAGYLVIYFNASPVALPRLPVLYFLWEAALLTLAWRLVYLYALSRGLFRRHALVVGSEATGDRLAALMRKHAPDVEVAATFETEGDEARPERLDDLVRHLGVSEIVLAQESPLPPGLMQALVRWQEQGVEVISMAAEYEHLLRRVPIDRLEPDWMFTSLPEWVRARDASRALKRIVDLLVALVGLAVLVVLTPFVAALIVLDAGRPVFFRQRRVGAGGRVFTVLKFRTMVRGAEANGPRWATVDDPRVTRSGRWLRRSRLDELPQVLRVLGGDMSIVGPRPERPEFAEQLEQQIPFYRTRLMVRPGLTGWAQVSADYGDSVADAALKLEYDLYYIKHRSLSFDLAIVFRTIGTVLGMRGQ